MYFHCILVANAEPLYFAFSYFNSVTDKVSLFPPRGDIQYHDQH